MVEPMGIYKSQTVVRLLRDVTYDSNDMDVTRIIWVAFFVEDQFSGFSGSSGPSNSTTLGSSTTPSFGM